MMPCPSEDELLELIDGGVIEDRAARIRGHADGCARCAAVLQANRLLISRIARPLADGGAPSVESVMSQLRAPPSRRRWVVGAAAAMAMAASVLLVVRMTAADPAGFQPRGGTRAGTARAELRFHAGPDLTQVVPGLTVRRDLAFVASYRHDQTVALYLLAFMVDQAGTVHWLYPAHTDPAKNPTAELLAPTRGERMLPDSVVLDGPATGRASLVSLVSVRPLTVSDIESLPAAELGAASLRARFSDAQVEVRDVELAAEESP